MPNVYVPDAKVTLAAITCVNCGLVFAWPDDLETQRRKDGRNFYCPNGHVMAYNKQPTQDERLRKETQRLVDELARANRRAEQANADADGLRLRVKMKDRQLSARKGQLTRIKNRVANGVCPCCTRSFTNLHRHMTTKHPDYVSAPDPLDDPTDTPPPAAPLVAPTPQPPVPNGREIRILRQKLGWTVARLAHEAGLAAGSLNTYEKGTAPPSTHSRLIAILREQGA